LALLAIALGAILAFGLAAAPNAAAQVHPPPPPPPSLKPRAVPEPPNLSEFVKNRDFAVLLGKALFWDIQAGSDGEQACATCHYHAGADTRITNTVHPGPDGEFALADSAGNKVNPLTFLVPQDQDIDDIVGSGGVVTKDFIQIIPGESVDDGVNVDVAPFYAHRQVTGRNAPTVINAAFNYRSFWDGRAENGFNGVDPFGWRSEGAEVIRSTASGVVEFVKVNLKNSSLASQAVGPALSGAEMSWNGRGFHHLGKKLLALRPLGSQKVDSGDSVLGDYALAGSKKNPGLGLAVGYREMIEAAFQNEWWDSTERFDEDCLPTKKSGEYSQMECNFSLIWGLAIQMYEGTLVSDDSPFDNYREGQYDALTQEQVNGFAVFMGPGKCISCHNGPEFTGASVAAITAPRIQDLEEGVIEHMLMGDGEVAFYDNGFYNLGVRAAAEDVGIGGTDPWGRPLSHSRLAQLGTTQLGDDDLCFLTLSCNVSTGDRVAVDGAFKTSSLRNVELTGPFFHTGRYATLEQVVEFYSRGGDRRLVSGGDTTGSGDLGQGGGATAGSNLDDDIKPLGLTGQQQSDLVAFMKSLTDERVRYERAPFDHPELPLPNGKVKKQVGADGNNTPLLPFEPM
jgi:cytochrome c peroxidase